MGRVQLCKHVHGWSYSGYHRVLTQGSVTYSKNHLLMEMESEWARRGRTEEGWQAEAFDYCRISLPLGLALGSPIFPSGCEGKQGFALESLQGRRDLT